MSATGQKEYLIDKIAQRREEAAASRDRTRDLEKQAILWTGAAWAWPLTNAVLDFELGVAIAWVPVILVLFLGVRSLIHSRQAARCAHAARQLEGKLKEIGVIDELAPKVGRSRGFNVSAWALWTVLQSATVGFAVLETFDALAKSAN